MAAAGSSVRPFVGDLGRVGLLGSSKHERVFLRSGSRAKERPQVVEPVE
jgi:hypothetical protein